jgi:phytoene synthase
MRRGSTTFFNSSLFFPRDLRSDVMALYAFVRTADDFVDRMPQDRDGFLAFRNDYLAAEKGQATDYPVIRGFLELSGRCGFDPKWTHEFLNAMEQDLWKKDYATLEETEAYMRGSAESVGLMMARIMKLPDDSLPYARLLGKAFQYLNFIRDIREDLDLGRVYIPRQEIEAAGLPELTLTTAVEYPESFAALVGRQLELYRMWREEASEGFKFIPRRYLVAIRTAADVFDTTAAQIEASPNVVLKRKVRPSKARVLLAGVRNLIGPPA